MFGARNPRRSGLPAQAVWRSRSQVVRAFVRCPLQWSWPVVVFWPRPATDASAAGVVAAAVLPPPGS
eukprot:4980440-Lingulodinium_polyedra.AAC.1